MARPPGYARFYMTSNRFPEFRMAIKEAGFKGCAEAGELAVEMAKRLEERHNKSGDTNRSISSKPWPNGFALIVGTLQGVFIEYGTKERKGPRGRVRADPYLHPAALMAARLLPALVKRNMHGIKAFVPTRGATGIKLRDTATGQMRGSIGAFPARPPY